MKCETCKRRLLKENFCISCQRVVTMVSDDGKVRMVPLWRMLEPYDVIQPGDHYASSLSGGLYRCTPDMMGKKLPYMHMPHLRPAGTRVETVP